MDVLSDHLAAEDGGFVTGFVVISEIIDSDGDVAHIVLTPEDQADSRTLGLLDFGTQWFHTSIQRTLDRHFDRYESE